MVQFLRNFFSIWSQTVACFTDLKLTALIGQGFPQLQSFQKMGPLIAWLIVLMEGLINNSPVF